MSDPFDEALGKAEAEAAAAHAAAVARKAAEQAKSEARHSALRVRLDALKVLVASKEAVFSSRGFRISEAIDKDRSKYGLLLSGGRKRISISLDRSDAFTVSVYWEGVRDPDGWQAIINTQAAANHDEVMAILGDWIVRYGQTEIK